MFDNDTFPAPPDETIVWRYLDLEKLLAILSSRKLHFTRLDQFKDPWEGATPDAVIAEIKSIEPEHVAQGFLKSQEFLRQTGYVSCWHISEYESAALWDQYSTSAGFAIKTTVLGLRESIRPPMHALIGAVDYINYDAPTQNFRFGNTLKFGFLKRKSFEHERELRLLAWLIPEPDKDGFVDPSTNPPGIDLDADLERLVQTVLLSPTANEWLLPHVKRLFEVFGLPNVEVRQSDLYRLR